MRGRSKSDQLFSVYEIENTFVVYFSFLCSNKCIISRGVNTRITMRLGQSIR